MSARGLWSDEANHEAELIMNRKMSALNISGGNSKVVAKEVFNSLYELTRPGNNPKDVKAADVDYYLNLKPEFITRTFLADTFADLTDSSDKNNIKKRDPKYRTWDRIKIPKDHFYEGQEEIITTIGKLIGNKFVFEGAGVIHAIKYVNDIWNKKTIGNIDSLIGQLYLEDIIDRKQFNQYLDRRDTLGYWLNGMLAHTISAKMTKPLPEIEKRKKELLKKYANEIANGNIDVMTQISDELVAYAKELLKGDPGMNLYDSGDLDFGNNYKNNSIIKGAVMNKITGEYDFIDTSFMNGIQIKDIPAHANSILASQYPASIATADSGYMGKKLLALLQMMQVDADGTDCGTKNLIPVRITNNNKNDMVYTYIEEGGTLKMLTRDNVGSYVGKTVFMRSPMSCTNEKICSKCAGKLFYLLGVEHAGLFSTQVSHTALNLGLKAKHNSLIELTTLNPDELIEDI